MKLSAGFRRKDTNIHSRSRKRLNCLFSSLKTQEIELFNNQWGYGSFYFSERLIALKYSFPGKFLNHGFNPKILLLDNHCFQLYTNYTFL